MVDKVLFDTSVLVPTFLKDHAFHSACIPWFRKAIKADILGFVSVHTLAELYSVLTRLPIQPKLTPQEVQSLLSNLDSFQKVVLQPEDYARTIDRLVDLRITGGGIYDALIAQAALQIKADILLTANSKDFVRLGNDVASIVRGPSVK